MAIPSLIPRDGLYTYATWLSKAMAGKHQCHYAGWFKSHFEVQGKQDANLGAWTAEHTAMVHDCTADYCSRGFRVYVESQKASESEDSMVRSWRANQTLWRSKVIRP